MLASAVLQVCIGLSAWLRCRLLARQCSSCSPTADCSTPTIEGYGGSTGRRPRHGVVRSKPCSGRAVVKASSPMGRQFLELEHHLWQLTEHKSSAKVGACLRTLQWEQALLIGTVLSFAILVFTRGTWLTQAFWQSNACDSAANCPIRPVTYRSVSY